METKLDLEKKTIEKLQDLIRINIDSFKGFKSAAETVDDGGLRQIFSEYAAQRRQNAAELRSYVEMNDEEAENSGSIKGDFHRWWLSARGALNSGDKKVVLIEAERGEDAIKERYEDVLKETAGSAVNDVLLRQYEKVKKGHDRIRDLRDAQQ